MKIVNPFHSSTLWQSLALGGGILFFAFCASIVIIPQAQQMIALRDILQQTENEKQLVQNARIQSIQAQEEFKRLEESILTASLPTEKDIIQFFESFERAAEQTTVLQRVELKNDKRIVQDGIVTIPATIHLTGSLNHLLQFLGYIEQENFYLNPTSLSFQGKGKEQDLVIECQTFWRQE